MKSHYIDGQWRRSSGEPFVSLNPANEQQIWVGKAASASDVQLAVDVAHQAFTTWRKTSFEQRVSYLSQFNQIVTERRSQLAGLISQESGKPLWDASKEVQAVLGKLAISIEAYQQRSGSRQTVQADINQTLHHRPHGVMAVFGPYNFPCHLPNGHIIPALLAGNTVVFKPSELTPACAEFMTRCWQDAGLPAGVFNLVQGGKSTGMALAAARQVAGILFTGSESTGKALHRQFAGRPEIMLALEMGGNNPLIVMPNSKIKESLYITLESAFISAGQRCTCARRLLVPEGDWGDAFIQELVTHTDLLPVGLPDSENAPFVGAMISAQAVDQVLLQQQRLVNAGAKILVPCYRLPLGKAFVSPGIIDVSNISPLPDEEIFGPLLQVIRYRDLAQAIELANQTRFGLSAGLISEDSSSFTLFSRDIRAGIVNWNRPLTGASSALPFGGIGCSGNHRASAFYAADYCSFPVAGLSQVSIPDQTDVAGYFDHYAKE